MKMPEPKKQHLWLQKLVGDWTYESDCNMGPGQPSQKFGGTESVRPVGQLWVVGEGRGEMPGGGMANMMITLGYDPQKERFVGTWIGSMMTNLWIYDGELDAGAKVLSLYAEGPDCMNEGKIGKYKDVIEFNSDDQRTLSSHSMGEDGKWQKFMTATYRRKK